MPTSRNDPKPDTASLRAQSVAFRSFAPARPPEEPSSRELWLQHAAGFILFEKVRAAGLATLGPHASEEARAAVKTAVNNTIYALMMQVDGVADGLRGSEYEVELTFGVQLTKDGTVVDSVDLREGDGFCMGYHGWIEGDFGEDPVVET